MLKSIFCTFHARKKKKKNVRNPNILPLTLVEADTPKLTLSNLKRNTSERSKFFLSYLLHCCAWLPRHQYRGQVLLVLSLRNQEMWIPPQKPLRKWQEQGWGVTPHFFHTFSTQRKCGKRSVGVKVAEVWLGRRRRWGKAGRRRERKWMRDKEKLDLFS